MSIETTPPPTPLMQRRLLDPINQTTTAFQSMTMNTNLPLTPPKTTDVSTPTWPLSAPSVNSLFPYPKTNTPQAKTNLLTPTNMDRYLIEHRHLSDSVYKSSRSIVYLLFLKFILFNMRIIFFYSTWYNNYKYTSIDICSTY